MDGRSRLQIPTADLPAGPQSVIARAVDRVGNFATTTANFTIAVPPGSVPSDRDGDGVLDDQRLQRHQLRGPAPARREVPGNGLDDDCSGGDAPARLSATVQNSWTSTRTFSRVLTLKARNVPAGATIETRCRGRGCPFRLRTLAVAKAGDVDLRKRYFRKSKLRVGAVARNPRARAQQHRQGRPVHGPREEDAAQQLPLPRPRRDQAGSLHLSCPVCGS